MDYLKPLWDFTDRILHVHAKDVRMDMSAGWMRWASWLPLQYYTPKLPGLE